jgi:cell division protein FtsL
LRRFNLFFQGDLEKMIVSGNVARMYSWQRKTKRKINIDKKTIRGFIDSTVLVVALLFVAAGIYMYSINSSAAKGYQMRQVEKQIQDLKKENEDLKIKEAELRSLYHIEESSKNLNMGDLKNVSYIEETGPVAMK